MVKSSEISDFIWFIVSELDGHKEIQLKRALVYNRTTYSKSRY